MRQPEPLPLESTSSTDPLVAVGIFVAIVVVGGLGMARSVVFYDSILGVDGAQPHEAKTNCPACGARIAADRDGCDYCGESLPETGREVSS